MRLQTTATPSNTPSNSPTQTPSNTQCPPTPSNTSTLTPTPSITQTYTPTITTTPTITPTPVCNQLTIQRISTGVVQTFNLAPTPAYLELTSIFSVVCSSYLGDNYVFFTSTTTTDSVIYSVLDGQFLVTQNVGTADYNSCSLTGNGVSNYGTFNTGFTFNGTIYPNSGTSTNGLSILTYSSCIIPSPTPSNTPTNTSTPSTTPTNTLTPTNTETPTVTPTNTLTPTNTTTPTITPTSTPCPCVCGASIQNDSAGSITYQYTDCLDVVYSGTILVGATLILPCGEPSIYVKYGSISTSGPSTITYGSCGEPPTPTPTSSITPTPSITPTETTTPTPTNTPTITPSPCLTTDYLLFNETGTPQSWTALDCANNVVGNTIPAGQQANTGCVQNGTLSEGSNTIVSSTAC